MGLIQDWGAAALRALPAETAHRWSLAALQAGFGGGPPHWARDEALAATLAGLALPNPFGLAAGYDKNAEAPDALLRLGFGFVEVGTITPLPQAGNPKPRLFRLRADGAVINRMGFNNEGLEAACRRLALRGRAGGIVGVNVGANKDSADRVGDYCLGLMRAYPYASYITANVSSPNTPGLRGLQSGEALEELLARLTEAWAQAAGADARKPLFLKIAPDMDEDAGAAIAARVVAYGWSGMIVSNTTLARPESLTSAERGQAGGLSGRPLFESSTRLLRAVARAGNGQMTLIGVGGVHDGASALAKIKAGAQAVQLYSALALEGPGLLDALAADVLARLKAEGFASIAEAVGADLK